VGVTEKVELTETTMDAHEKNQLMFMQLVMMFHTLTMHQLGKIKNPVTGKVEGTLLQLKVLLTFSTC